MRSGETGPRASSVSSWDLTSAGLRGLKLLDDRSHPPAYLRWIAPVASLGLRHGARRESLRIRAEATTKGCVAAGAHSLDELLNLRRRSDVALGNAVIQRPAADQPYRQHSEAICVSLHEAPGITVPPVGVQRPCDDDCVEAGQVVNVARREHRDLCAGLGQCVTDHGGKARGTPALGSIR